MDDVSVLNLFLEAGIVVKIVMLILFIASNFILDSNCRKVYFFRKIKKLNDNFLKKFWSGKDLDNLYKEVSNDGSVYGAMSLFKNYLMNTKHKV